MASKIGTIWGFLKTRKKWWLAPVIVFLLLIGFFIFVVTQSAVAPFIYTIF